MDKTIKRFGLILLILFSLPILLHVYNPSMQLGGLGLLLGVIGMTISPIIILVVLFLYAKSNWN